MSHIPGFGWSKPVFQLGHGKTLAVPMTVHEISRKKLIDFFHDKDIKEGLIILQGGEDQCRYDTDTEILFHQDSWFHYLFGVKESGMFGIIDISNGQSSLFIPRLPESYNIWCGEIHPPKRFKESYATDNAFYADELESFIDEKISSNSSLQLHVMYGQNSDSGSYINPPPAIANNKKYEDKINKDILYNLLAQCRTRKSSNELILLHYAAYIASLSHVSVMREASKYTFEYEMEAKFAYEAYRTGGCRRLAYNAICACGPNASVLHYGHAGAPNSRQLSQNDIALLDMGVEYHGYVSDITCSFPISGKFTPEQKIVYELVLEAQKAVMQLAKPGISWVDCHKAAEKEIVKGLLKAGVFTNPDGLSEDDLLSVLIDEQSLGAVFFPHGLGHLIGCDTHDVGGYLPSTPHRETRDGLKSLRTARILEKDMVLTNEPGCYFITPLIKKALSDETKKKYFNEEVLNKFINFGGVRLEDVIVIRENDSASLSTVPRALEEIEDVMSGGVWPPAEDKCPLLKRQWAVLSEDQLSMSPIEVKGTL